MPTKSLSFISPYEKLFLTPPDYTTLKVFGCLCFPWLKPYTTSKLQPRSVKCTFIGYSRNHKGYYCLDNSTGRIYISRHVFHEDVFPFKFSPSIQSAPDLPSTTKGTLVPLLQAPTISTPPLQSTQSTISAPPSLPSIPLVSTSPQNIQTTASVPQPPLSHGMVTKSKGGIYKPKTYAATFIHPTIPTCYSQATKDPH